jgi:hypothetical protein
LIENDTIKTQNFRNSISLWYKIEFLEPVNEINITVNIFDGRGKQVLRKIFPNLSESTIDLDVSKFEPGVYKLSIRNDFRFYDQYLVVYRSF